MHWICAVLLVAHLSTLTLLVYADPPDPLWIGGIWDDDDGDNIVAVVTTTVVLSNSGQLVLLHVEPSPTRVPPPPQSQPVRQPVYTFKNRAPPDA
jgi:hypothetical protein